MVVEDMHLWYLFIVRMPVAVSIQCVLLHLGVNFAEDRWTICPYVAMGNSPPISADVYVAISRPGKVIIVANNARKRRRV
jgi:hypothetical protein